MSGYYPTGKIVRRTIGPIPPRDKSGKLLIKPLLAKRPKLNIVGTPVLDEKGQPIEEMVDTREPWEYKLYEAGYEHQMLDGATKGLRLFQVDYDIEPIMLVYAKDADDALRVYKAEWGIKKLNNETDPKITPVEAA